MFNYLKWEHLGTVAVDSGNLMVVDPCYVLKDKRRGFADDNADHRDYSDFLDAFPSEGYVPTVEPWGAGMGLCIGTTYGDGLYNVYGVKDRDGRVTHWMVVTDGSDMDTDEEGESFNQCSQCWNEAPAGAELCDECLESERDSEQYEYDIKHTEYIDEDSDEGQPQD